jgi:hypothetical protein
MPGRPKEAIPKDIADEIVRWIGEGKTLREFCRQAGKPSFVTVYAWQKKDAKFAERIACARESGEEQIAQECLEIADDARNDWETRTNKDGSEYQAINPEVVQRSRLRVDTRLKLLAKWNPRKYGDKVENTVVGADGGPVQHSIAVEFVKPK